MIAAAGIDASPSMSTRALAACRGLVQLSGSYDSALCGGMKVRRMRIACGNKTRESNRG